MCAAAAGAARPAVELDLRVERDHRRRVDAPLQRRGQRPLVERRAHQQHRVVAREEAEVVAQHAQAAACDPRVGRVHVDHVDLAARQRLVGQAVVESAPRVEGEPVRGLQRRPAVGAHQELVRQPEAQPGRLRPLQPRQRRDRVDAEPRRVGLAHRQRVGVVEAQRHRGLQPARRQQAVQLVDRGRARPGRLRQAQQLARDRAGVLGVDVDRAAGERPFEDAGVAQPRAVLGRDAGVQQRLPHQLAEHVALGEALRADDHRRLGRRRAAADEQRQHGGEQPSHPAIVAHPPGGLARRAVTGRRVGLSRVGSSAPQRARPNTCSRIASATRSRSATDSRTCSRFSGVASIAASR